MTNDDQADVPGQIEEIEDLAGNALTVNDRNKGPQPIVDVMR